MSIGPSASRTWRTSSAAKAPRATSPATPTTVAPCVPSSARTAAPTSEDVRAAMATRTPAAANAEATASPMPREPPVMSATRPSSVPSTSPHYHPDGAQQDYEVRPQRPLENVLEVERHPIVEVVDLRPPRHLPQAREARAHGELGVLPRLEAHEFTRRGWARAH